jgi:hypothetical protein
MGAEHRGPGSEGYQGYRGMIRVAKSRRRQIRYCVSCPRNPRWNQDALAVAMLSMAETEAPVTAMDEQTRVAIREGMEQARRREFVPDVEIEALWKQHVL